MLILGIVLLFIIIIVFCVPFKIKTEAELRTDLRVSIHIIFLKLIKYNFIFPEPKISKKNKKIQNKAKVNYKAILKILELTIKKLKKAEFYLDAKIGLDDAALTAQATGGLYIISGFLIALVNHYTKLEKTKVNIIPNFSKMDFYISFCCIAKIKIANIINAIIKLILLKFKTKRGSSNNDRPSNKRADEYRYGKHKGNG